MLPFRWALIGVHLLMLLGTLTNAILPNNYESLTSTEKMNILWGNILNDIYPIDQEGNYPPSTVTEQTAGDLIFNATFLKEVFEEGSDELLNGRPKIISPTGVIGQFELIVSPGSPYTGVFSSGSYLALGRMSGQPDGTLTPANPLKPFFAMKFLYNGKKSENLFAGYDTIGQSSLDNSTSFFQNPISTGYDTTLDGGVDPAHDKLIATLREVLANLPGGPRDRPQNTGTLGLVDLASYKWPSGQKEARTYAPFRIGFTGTPEAMLFRQTDFNYRAQLVRDIPANIHLLTVTAQRSPCDEFKPLGELWLRSKLVAGHYEDQILRFQQPFRQWDPSFITPDGIPCDTNECGPLDVNVCPPPNPSSPSGNYGHKYHMG
ncbi:hypothetical protein BV898_03536 [Hypsibius exemplaris]|uniref:Uncharacterized protein n=1 Tax=Hypsibius exemplaris TaxID=2072580 RepID=A0A1W0X552_HYPEX|nr:hypothetical protein BV898_03536 [Hypsibius exemplaris]